MRYIMILILLIGQQVFAQTRTEEQRMTIEKATGDTLITESVIISRSRDITPRQNLLLINPLKFFLFYNISYMHQVSEGVVLGGGVQMPTVAGLDGFGVNAEIRFYPTGKNLAGFYIAPNISYNRLIGEEDELLNAFSIGALAGWQWFPGDEFAIGLGIGADYYTGSGTDNSGPSEHYSGFVPAVRFDIGYTW